MHLVDFLHLGFIGWLFLVVLFLFGFGMSVSMRRADTWEDVGMSPWFHWLPLLIPMFILFCLLLSLGNDLYDRQTTEVIVEILAAMPWAMLMALLFHLLSRFVFKPWRE